VQLKVFRIEQMFAERRGAAPDVARDSLGTLAALREEATDATMQQFEEELAVLRDTIARNRADLAALIGERSDRRMARAAGELGAAVDAMEGATQKILQAAEAIDDGAKSLGAVLKQGYERGLTQDIQDHAVKIYEACNFQDLAGQRIAKVIGLLSTVEEKIGALVERCAGFDQPGGTTLAAKPAVNHTLLHGPKLDGDPGHTDQKAIDAIFK
jgi:chemotaxis protein CheZ